MVAKQLRVANPITVAKNAANIAWFRTLAALLVATTAGVLGVTGVGGVVLYLAAHVVSQGLLLVKLGSPASYTGAESSTLGWFLEGLGDSVLPYLVAWSFVYAVVHFF